MRPSPEELLLSLRVSLNESLLPHVTDRWARYVGTAMDLVLQHLQLRLAGEHAAIDADNLDMATTLAELAQQHPALVPAPPAGISAGAGDADAINEALRTRVVDALRQVDEAVADAPGVDEVRDQLHRLIRRQVDRVNPLVEPLYMSFRPAVSS